MAGERAIIEQWQYKYKSFCSRIKGYTFIPLTFDADEHVKIGEQLTIGKKVLTLPNGVRLKFADIIALGGDFYGIPEEPIANPLENPIQPDPGAVQRFKNAYSTLADTPYEGEYKKQLDKLVKMIKEETDGKKPECHHSDREWDEVTGGYWIGGIPVFPGNMLKLAAKNFDHFGSRAGIAYRVGHEYAIQKAREAGRSSGKDREKLRDIAYSIEAFALHFFTDSFSSGHIRTPRVELQMNVTPGLIGDLLSKFMHDEDNKFGLHVANVRGDKWIAYGDGMLMRKKDKENFKMVVEAAQTSVDQVVKGYEDPNTKLDPCAVTDFLPFVDLEEKNNTPLFQVKGAKLHRRSDINDLQDTETITNWYGFSTASKLQWWYKPKNPAITV